VSSLTGQRGPAGPQGDKGEPGPLGPRARPARRARLARPARRVRPARRDHKDRAGSAAGSTGSLQASLSHPTWAPTRRSTAPTTRRHSAAARATVGTGGRTSPKARPSTVGLVGRFRSGTMAPSGPRSTPG
jgi:hypothetical protein